MVYDLVLLSEVFGVFNFFLNTPTLSCEVFPFKVCTSLKSSATSAVMRLPDVCLESAANANTPLLATKLTPRLRLEQPFN